MKYLVDTSLLIELLRGNEKVAELLENLPKPVYISGVTEAELLSGKECKQPDKERKIIELISLFQKINPSNEINRIAGKLRRERDMSLLDALIAATAIKIGATLITLDKDFERVREVKVEIFRRTR